uniref:Uncharacterized protein n=1 Tax=Arundo donax TaxID=35708 RepID=A0A0A8Z5J0_ARUDO
MCVHIFKLYFLLHILKTKKIVYVLKSRIFSIDFNQNPLQSQRNRIRCKHFD